MVWHAPPYAPPRGQPTTVLMVLETRVTVFPGLGLELLVEVDDIIFDPVVRKCGHGCP